MNIKNLLETGGLRVDSGHAIKEIMVVYGTRSGNSKTIAGELKKYLHTAGLEAGLMSTRDFEAGRLKEVRYLLLVISTHGEGDPPVAAERFYNRLISGGMPPLPELRYAVLALGDSNYRNFCKTGADLDRRLEELGAKRMLEVVGCDLDFSIAARNWMEDACRALLARIPGKQHAGNIPPAPLPDPAGSGTGSHTARISSKRRLTGKGSSKYVFHLGLSAPGGQIDHMPGDCLKIRGRNSRALTDKVLRTLGYRPAITVEIDGKRHLLKELLLKEYELTLLTPVVVKKYAALAGGRELKKMAENEAALQEYTSGRDVLDLVSDFRKTPEPEEFLGILRRLHPRQYSIASGRMARPGEIDLTVSWMNLRNGKRNYRGVCSTYLHELVEEGDSLSFEFEKNNAFSFPDNPRTPLIMLATSTGIAPFRAVLENRAGRGIKANTWLFFGDRNEKTDFLYGDEIRSRLDSGVLERLDLAFSRDGKKKVYLQHRLKERQRELLDWLDRGAHLYLCGTKPGMAASIRSVLVSALRKERNWPEEKAAAYLLEMKEANRYCEDIY